MTQLTDKNKIALSETFLDGEIYLKISNNDEMRPFFMSIVSHSNHWMFISSNGGLSAGRKNSEFSLFPYYTDDKITEAADITGSKSIFNVQKNGETYLWEPFSDRQDGKYNYARNLYKNKLGNKVIFEEINQDLELTFRYQWSSSDLYGFVKKSYLINDSDRTTEVSILDGIQNLLPYGVGSFLQNQSSNLVDAYKRNQLEKDSGLGIFALSAIIVDKAEPSEALKVNIAYSLGLKNPKHLLSSLQLKAFRNNQKLHEETDVKAEKGAYFVFHNVKMASNSMKEWMTITDVNKNHSEVISLISAIKSDSNLTSKIKLDIEKGSKDLIHLNAASDALQKTQDGLRDTRHFANTLFNIMRGGIFDDNYTIEKWDLQKYLSQANKSSYKDNLEAIQALPATFTVGELNEFIESCEDDDLIRLCQEYMPLKFSRRHGDPSRPWNKFSINTQNEDGSKVLDYQGNWRDIFQNWEALAVSYPDFICSMIHKFLNATTFDGYNPYRVTKSGFDWETIEPDDPWSYIGYWGDHQIIYLQKLLEIAEKYQPGQLHKYFSKEIFVYANVPYKIKSYEEILEKPKDTIDFDFELDRQIHSRKESLGADGALLLNDKQIIHKVNFIEKMLATLLAKLSNFIPDGGIWMNTQRPEWNDANNALVGNGVSMVTLYYIRRFLNFFHKLLSTSKISEIRISEELLTFYDSLSSSFTNYQSINTENIDDAQRKLILDELGHAGSDYRQGIYSKSFSGSRKSVKLSSLSKFIETTLKIVDQSISKNQRKDHLFHAYNLMSLTKESGVAISHLSEMLEGQVAVLSSGYLDSKSALKVLDALKKSKLFRHDQYTYILYPNKELPRFLDKNIIEEEVVNSSILLSKLIEKGNTSIIQKDINGGYHFNGNFKNAKDLEVALTHLTEYSSLIEKEKANILGIFEVLFDHKSFTGRSGTFYGYEGLGSIYWHMVSKLLLAVQECCFKAIKDKEEDVIVGRLLEHYYEINEGIGVHKSPSLYGAFPTDPYSHTPFGKGAQQPGMTGQVKEDILCRFGEFGVMVNGGKLLFNPCLLRKSEFLVSPADFDYVDVNGHSQKIELGKNSLAFTYCQVPIIYKISEKQDTTVYRKDSHYTNESLTLDRETSKMIFSRKGKVQRIEVNINKLNLR